MTDFIQNLYVSSGTGRLGVLTNVQLAEVETDLGRRTSNFLPYSSLYHTVYPRQRVSQRRRSQLYKWSVVGALVLLVGVVVVAGALEIFNNSFVPPRNSPFKPTTTLSLNRSTTAFSNFSTSNSSNNYFSKGSTDKETENAFQDGTTSSNSTSTHRTNDLLSVVKTC